MTGEQGAARVGVRLRVVRPDDEPLRRAVLGTQPRPGQEAWASTAAQTLPAADADPDRTPFAVLDGPRVVGFGVLDRGDLLRRLVDDPARAVLLRGFYLDGSAQGAGLGTAAAARVPQLARSVHPGTELVVLTVDGENAAAMRAYRHAGYVDTGVLALGAGSEPQHVLVARA